MKILLAGRTEILIKTGDLLVQNGHELAGIITCRASKEYAVDEDDFQNYAEELEVPFFNTQKINSKESIAFVSGLGQIDITLSINWIGIVGEEFISKFRLGVLNAHGGDLPRYRGNACQAWAIINGEERIGLCIHKMIAGELDAGDIISRSYLPIDINTRIGSVYEWMTVEIPDLFLKAINSLSRNSDFILEEQSKDPSKGLRCYPRKPEDGRIDWHRSAKEIVRLVNASSEPFAGAFCLNYEGELIKIWRAELFDDNENWIGIPGQVSQYLINDDCIILTGNGKIRVSDVSFNSKRDKPRKFFKSLRQRFY